MFFPTLICAKILTMTKRILYLAPSAGVGGAETFLLQTALLHQRPDFTPVYAFLRDGPLVAQVRALGAIAHVLPTATRLRNPWSCVRAIAQLTRLIQQENISLVHSTLAYGALFGAPAARLAGVPHVWFQHGPVSGWQDRLAAWLPSQCILVNSAHTASAQGKLGSRPLEKLRLGVVPARELPSPESARAVLRQRLAEKFPGEKIEFITTVICRPQPQKGVELWLAALAQVRARGHAVAGVLIGGNFSPGTEAAYERHLLAEACRLRVPLLAQPFLAEPWNLAIGADALVCASLGAEGYGLTLAEANFYGVCAVAPAEGGPLDIIADRKNGLLFQPRNAESLARALEELFTSPQLRTELLRAGHDFSRTELPASRSIAQLEKKYAHWLDGTRA